MTESQIDQTTNDAEALEVSVAPSPQEILERLSGLIAQLNELGLDKPYPAVGPSQRGPKNSLAEGYTEMRDKLTRAQAKLGNFIEVGRGVIEAVLISDANLQRCAELDKSIQHYQEVLRDSRVETIVFGQLLLLLGSQPDSLERYSSKGGLLIGLYDESIGNGFSFAINARKCFVELYDFQNPPVAFNFDEEGYFTYPTLGGMVFHLARLGVEIPADRVLRVIKTEYAPKSYEIPSTGVISEAGIKLRTDCE